MNRKRKTRTTPNPLHVRGATLSSLKLAMCLCGCFGVPQGVRSIFCQGHDSVLRSKIINGQPTTRAARQYARDHWGLKSD